MKYALRYYTRSGNTQKLAEAMAAAIDTPALDISHPLEEYVDILFLGSSVYAFGIDDAVKDFIRDNAEKIGLIVSFSTAAVVTSAYDHVRKAAEECGLNIATQDFHCRGSFGPLHKNRPNAADLAAAQDFARKICGK